jgi:hypothetical protein
MVENAKNKELTEKIQEIQKDLNIVKNETFKTESNKIEIEKFVILFFSFDITNSSKYKTIDYLYWPVIIHHILKRIEEEVVIKFSGEAQLWRILGDEIIFVKKVASVEEMAKIVEKINKIKNNIIGEIQKKEFLKLKKHKNELPYLGNILSLKSSAWVGLVANQMGKDYDFSTIYDNIEISYETKGEKNKIIEFLGNDIDTGFRISKAVISEKMVLSFELAYLLFEYYKTEQIKNSIHIITYRNFKGIWNDKKYPVIWYFEGNTDELIESFDYNEYSEQSLVTEFLNIKNSFDKEKIVDGIPSNMYITSQNTFDRIIRDNNLQNKIKRIKENLKSSTIKPLQQFKLELHCAVVCYHKDSENNIEVLILKRSSKRNHKPNVWEFGCAKAEIDKTLIETIKKEYHNDIGIDIDVICDSNREDKQPIPLALYTIEKNSDYHKGILMIAEAKIKELTLNAERYTDHKWIKESQIDEFEESINDFKDSLKKVFKYLEGEKLNG